MRVASGHFRMIHDHQSDVGASRPANPRVTAFFGEIEKRALSNKIRGHRSAQPQRRWMRAEFPIPFQASPVEQLLRRDGVRRFAGGEQGGAHKKDFVIRLRSFGLLDGGIFVRGKRHARRRGEEQQREECNSHEVTIPQ